MDDDLELRIQRDKIKNKFCQDNNINLLRIKYDENINEKLINFFNCLKKHKTY